MIEVDLNEMDYYCADSCAISHSAFLLSAQLLPITLQDVVVVVVVGICIIGVVVNKLMCKLGA